MTESPDVHALDRRWPRRIAVIGSFLAALAALLVIVVTSLHLGAGAPRAGPVARLAVDRLGDLAVAVASPAGAPLQSGLGILVVGGLNQAGAAIDAVQQFAGSKTTMLPPLPTAVRGGAAVRIGNTAYLLGGAGSSAGGAAILSLPSPGRNPPAQVAALPRPVSDSTAATLDGAAYLFGGFTGQQATATIFAWQPDAAPHPTAHLPSRLLFAAAVTVGRHVIIVGGTVNGVPTRAILRFDPRAHRVTTIGQLPLPVSRAAAGVIGGQVYVVGGRVNGPHGQTRAIYRIDPDTGRAAYAGALPVALSDAAIASTGDKLVVAGGVTRTGQVQRAVYELSVSH
jgi:N-acetylneuraminic acid mutarotase